MRVVAVRVASVLVLTAIAVSGCDAGSDTEPAAAPTASPSPDREAEPERERPQLRLARSDDPTVYDSQDELERCARIGGEYGPAPGIRALSNRVERLRKLDFDRRVDTRLVSRAEVGRRFARGYLSRYGPRAAARDQKVLEALRLVPEGSDLHAQTSELLTTAVSGFYNPRRDTLYAGSAAGTLTPYEEMVLAHELDHALIDQTLGLPRTTSRDPLLADRTLAHQALAEGDATLVMTRYAARRFTSEDYAAFVSRFTQRAVSASSAIPYAVTRASEFPYYEGLLFVCANWRARKWAGVDSIYEDPPKTTADVLFPWRYEESAGERRPVAPGRPGRSWKAVPARAFGAFDVMLLLENADLLSTGRTVPGSHVDAVRGWDGGALRAWLRGDETTIHVSLVDAGVETRSGRRRRLCLVMRGWLEETFPDAAPVRSGGRGVQAWRSAGDLALLRCRRSTVELAKGPSPRAVRRLFAR